MAHSLYQIVLRGINLSWKSCGHRYFFALNEKYCPLTDLIYFRKLHLYFMQNYWDSSLLAKVSKVFRYQVVKIYSTARQSLYHFILLLYNWFILRAAYLFALTLFELNFILIFIDNDGFLTRLNLPPRCVAHYFFQF
jgi:hypothetical protein